MSSHDVALSLGPAWRRRLAGYLALARVSNTPTVITNVLAGAALATAAEPTARVIPLVLSLVLFYTAGMFLNDVCDYAIDCRERPQRPLPSGAVSRSSAAAAAVSLLALGSAILLAVSVASFVSGLLLVALIVVYDLWHKRNRLSPVLMAGTRMLAYVTAFVAFADAASPELVVAAALLGLYVLGLTAIAKVEASGALSGSWPVVLLLLPASYYAFELPIGSLALVVLFAAWTVSAVCSVYRSRDRDIGGGVQRLIAGIALYDSLVLAGPGGAPIAAAFAVAAFATAMFLQRHIAGT
jgi:4-hydroxybenzoate polyprenyltransferase